MDHSITILLGMGPLVVKKVIAGDFGFLSIYCAYPLLLIHVTNLPHFRDLANGRGSV